MSLITCCPACGTMFKVVPDQLKISEGWVRCGHCAEVFDASAHLQGGASFPEPGGQQILVESSDTSPLDTAPAGIESEHEARHDVDQSARPLAPLRPGLAGRQADLGAVRDAGEGPRSVSRWPAAEPPALPEPELHDLSFVRQARRKAFWGRPLVRASMLLLLLALGALLTLQVALHDRDRLAATHPDWRPGLEMLCERLNCKIGPLRQIESVVIDSSSFSKLRNDTYRLSFTLKNQAPTPVAMPAVELTVTDTQDQPLVRRVLLPSELGVGAAVIAAASEASASLALGVAISGPARVAGYRLLAFYP